MFGIVVSFYFIDLIFYLFSLYCKWLPQTTTQYLAKHQIKSVDCCFYDFQSGDLLLFACENPYSIPTLAQKTITKEPFTHIGMVIRDPTTGTLRCWELEKSQNQDNEKKKQHFLCLSNLHSRIMNYRGTVCVRPLVHAQEFSGRQKRKGSFDEKRDNWFNSCVNRILHEECKKQHIYRSSFWIDSYDRFLNALHPPMPIKNHHTKSRAWICTDLILETYHATGIISDKRVGETLWPCEFSSVFSQDIELNAGWRLSPEVHLKTNRYCSQNIFL